MSPDQKRKRDGGVFLSWGGCATSAVKRYGSARLPGYEYWHGWPTAKSLTPASQIAVQFSQLPDVVTIPQKKQLVSHFLVHSLSAFRPAVHQPRCIRRRDGDAQINRQGLIERMRQGVWSPSSQVPTGRNLLGRSENRVSPESLLVSTCSRSLSRCHPISGPYPSLRPGRRGPGQVQSDGCPVYGRRHDESRP